MKHYLTKIADARPFQYFIVGIILLSSVLLGVETFPSIRANYIQQLAAIEHLILVIFVIEQIIRIGVHGNKPWRYFQNLWNSFDFIIVAVCFLPDSQFLAVLRIARILRIFRLVATVREAEIQRLRNVELADAYQQLTMQKSQLEALNINLIAINREKDEFLGIAAHDLKNPLSAIKGLSEEILGDYDAMTKNEVMAISSQIRESSERMFALITNLLDVGAIESGSINPTPVKLDMMPIVAERAQHYKKLAHAKAILLTFKHDRENYYILADADLMNQVIDNLISNAVKYSPPRTCINIRLRHDSDKIRCEIQDEGPGLSADDQTRLFGKFARLNSRPTGHEHSTGLGLFIVKKLVTAMGGDVWCESELDKGAMFIIEFQTAPQS